MGNALFWPPLPEGEEAPFIAVVPPVPDSPELADRGRRVVLYYGQGLPVVGVVPKDMMYAGWVIGKEVV